MQFQALELSLDLIRCLSGAVARLRTRDPRLAAQIKSAASSVALNLGEGRRRCGKDRLHHFRIAAGSAEEVRTALRVAQSWGDLAGETIHEALRLLDRILAILWKLAH